MRPGEVFCIKWFQKWHTFSAPTAPVNARCGTKSQTDIYLIWDEPLFANGDLKQYRINIRVRYRSSVEEIVETEFPVTESVVTGLQTGNNFSWHEIHLNTAIL